MLIRIISILFVSSVIGKSAFANSPLERVSCSSLFSNPTSQEPPRSAALAVQEMLSKAGTQLTDIKVHDEHFYEKVLKDPNFELGETYVDDLAGLNRSSSCDKIWAKKGLGHGKKEIHT